jgi:sugar phosphate isomerase/epimerase
MRESIHDYCRLGIVHSMIFPRSQEREDLYLSTLKVLLTDESFDVIEIGHLPFDSLGGVVPALIATAHASLTYSAHSLLFASKANPNSLDEGERHRAVSILKQGIDEAYGFGALDFQFLSRTFDSCRVDEHLASLVRSTVELCEYAASKGSMPVCLEIFDHTIDKKSLVGPAPLAKRYVEAVGREVDNFGLMVDCSHIPMIGESLDESIDPIAPYIVHAHMGNTLISDPGHPSYGDTHPRFGYPGSENDTEYLAAFLGKLLAIGYLDPQKRPILSFEIKPQANEDPFIVLANAKRTLRDAWRLA